MQADLPLTGKLVLDLTQGIAGPYCGRLLSEHGARVIKVEPPGGDWIRALGDGPEGESVHFLYYNLGKESITLDLKSEAGLANAKLLAAKADVVLESARPGVTERLGLGFEAVKALNPTVIYLSVSGFGQVGPRANDPLTDAVAQSFSGMISVNHGEDGVPHKIHTTIIDAVTGLYAFQAASMALFGGVSEAKHLDVSLMQSAAAVMGPKILEFAHLGRTPMLLNPPAGAYATADGWITVTLVKEAHFASLMAAMDLGEMAGDARYGSFPDRQAHQDTLKPPIVARMKERTTDEWLARFEAHGVLAGRINDYGQWLAEPQVAASNGADEITVTGEAVLPVPRTPARVSERRSAPKTGQDQAAITAEFGLG
jgi:crotonobetainyl-CoA:carnitine CoA-transferase CaiB-like acyl-CoA transferase